jgi:bacillithiol biosynthesis cysteine-adding enzyme BshC
VSDLYEDYCRGRDELIACFSRPPDTLMQVPPATGTIAEGVVACVNAQQAEFGVSARIPSTCSVIATGQQPALFTGPLYTVYKAITAIRVAAALNDRHGVVAVPLFWVGGDDHDFEEARTASILTRNHTHLRLQYSPASYRDGIPLHNVPVDDSLDEFIDAAAEQAPGSELRNEIAAALHETVKTSKSFSDWMAKLLSKLFEGTGLLIFTPSRSEVRRAAKPILRREIEMPLETTRRLELGTERLKRLGYDPQLQKKSNECNFFLECDGLRRKVIYQDGHFILPEERATYSQDELLALLNQNPERFSPNVVLRCIVQQHLFPTAAYIGGPGEVAYWAQFKPVFEFFELNMPVVYPRAHVLLTSTKNQKLLSKLGLTVDDLAHPADTLLERAMRSSNSNPAAQAFAQHRDSLSSAVTGLRKAVAARKPGFDRQLAAFEERMAAELQRIERSLLMDDVERVETVRSQIDRLCTSLMPDKKPQERVYCVLSFLFEYGWELVPRLMREIDVESFKLNVIEL